MADAFISSGASSLGASGLKALVTLFSSYAIAAKRNRNSVLKFVRTDISSDISTIGQAVNVPIYSTQTMGSLTDGNALVKSDTLGSSRTVTLADHNYQSFGFTDVGRALAGQSPELGVMKQRIADLFNGIESNVCSLAASDFNTNSVGSFASAITEAYASAAIEKLYDNKVPEGQLYGFLHQSAWGDFTQIANIVQGQIRGEVNPLVVGGTSLNWNNVQWMMHQGVNVNNTTEVSNFVFHPDAILFAQRALPTALPGTGVVQETMLIDNVPVRLTISYNDDYMAQRWTIDTLSGYTSGEEKFACEIRSVA